MLASPALLPIGIAWTYVARACLSPGFEDNHMFLGDWSAHASYLAAFLFSAAIPLLYYWHPAAPLLILPGILIALLGAEMVSNIGPVADVTAPPLAYRFLPYLYIPAQLAVIAWAVPS